MANNSNSAVCVFPCLTSHDASYSTPSGGLLYVLQRGKLFEYLAHTARENPASIKIVVAVWQSLPTVFTLPFSPKIEKETPFIRHRTFIRHSTQGYWTIVAEACTDKTGIIMTWFLINNTLLHLEFILASSHILIRDAHAVIFFRASAIMSSDASRSIESF